MKNPQLQSLIRELKKSSIENKVKLWKRIATDLDMSSSKRRVVNLSKINQYAKDKEIVVVPGKVLSMGELSKKLTIAALNYSTQAQNKIEKSGSKAILISDLVKNNPKGSKVRIIG